MSHSALVLSTKRRRWRRSSAAVTRTGPALGRWRSAGGVQDEAPDEGAERPGDDEPRGAAHPADQAILLVGVGQARKHGGVWPPVGLVGTGSGERESRPRLGTGHRA